MGPRVCNVHLFDKQRGGAWKATRDVREKGQGARGTVVVGVGILLQLSSMLAAIRHAGFLVGVRGVGVGFLVGCPVLPQQRCCLPLAAVFGVLQGGAAQCVAGRAVSGLRRMSVSRSSTRSLSPPELISIEVCPFLRQSLTPSFSGSAIPVHIPRALHPKLSLPPFSLTHGVAAGPGRRA